MAACPDSIGNDVLQRTQVLLGGSKGLGCALSNPYEAHDLLVRGLPVRAALQLVRSLHGLQSGPLLPSALGISRRTFERWREAPGATRLSPAQSGRVWVLAEALVLATDVLGSQYDAVEWLWRPAASLNGRRPIELLPTPLGARLIADHLDRLKHGVYT